MATPAVSRIYPKGFRSDILNDGTFMDGFIKAATSAAARSAIGAAALTANTFTGQQIVNVAGPTNQSSLVLNTPAGNVSGLNSSAAYWTAPAGVNNGGVIRPDFGCWGQEQNDGAGNVDRTVQIGFNGSATGGTGDTSQAANYLAFEHFWMGQPETHGVHTVPNGPTTIRTNSVVTPNSTKDPLWYHIGRQHDFYNQADNAGGLLPFFSLTNNGSQSAIIFQKYDAGTVGYYGLHFDVGGSGLNETTINCSGTTAATGNLQINASRRLKLQQDLIDIDATALSGAGQITFGCDMIAANNTTGWRSNITIKNGRGFLIDGDGFLQWGTQGNNDWPALGRMGIFNGLNTLLIEGRATTGDAIFGLNHASATGNVIFKHKNTTVVNINSSLALSLGSSSGAVGFYGSNGSVKPTLSGSKGGNTAIASIIAALVGWGAVIDTTT